MNKLQFTNHNHMQGDTQWFRIKSIPKYAKLLHEKRPIEASERSGSFHALFGNYEMYEDTETKDFYIDAKEDCILNHSLQSDLASLNNDFSIKMIVKKKDHRASIIPKGIYYVGQQNRFDPLDAIKKKQKD